jgi:hypothetical protein
MAPRRRLLMKAGLDRLNLAQFGKSRLTSGHRFDNLRQVNGREMKTQQSNSN